MNDNNITATISELDTKQAPNKDIAISLSEDIQKNSVVRFLFEEHGVRGEIMHMSEPLDKLINYHNYPQSVKSLLMELAVAAVLMATTLKIDGTVTVQIHGGKGKSAVKFAFVNIDKDLNFYGTASLLEDNQYENATFRELAGEEGILVISVLPQDGTRYQGIVSLDKDSLSQALEDYFRDSEQLGTTMILHHDIENMQAGGLMLQIIPNIDDNLNSLEHLTTLAKTLTQEELFSLSLNESLRRLYWNDKIRVFDSEKTEFHCLCSKERFLNSMRILPLEERKELSLESEGINTQCSICGCSYHFNQEDLQSIVKEEQKDNDENKNPNSHQEDAQIVYDN